MAADPGSKPEAAGAKLKVSKVVEGDLMCLRFAGTIDEDFDGPAAAEQVRGTLILDLGGVRRISSFGIREWVDFIRAAEARAHALYFIECSPKVVDQFNMVANFGGSGQVLSVQAPYRCDYCDDDRRRLLQMDQAYERIQNLDLPDEPCASCGNAEYFDEDPEAFFSYLQSQKPVEVDAAVANFLAARLDYRVSDAARRLRVDKVVERTGTFIRLSGDVDVSFPTGKLAEGLEGDVVIDLSAVGRVDEDGARQWTTFVQTVDPAAAQLYLRDCQPAFAEQAFTEEALAGRVEVISFFMPFRCPECDTTAAQRVATAEHFDVLKFATSPELTCSECGAGAPSIASGELLARCGNLIRPRASAELLEFADRAHDQILRPPATSPSPAAAAPAAPAPQTSRTASIALLSAVLGGVLTAVVLAVWGFGLWPGDKKPKPAAFDEGGELKEQEPDPPPAWFAALQQRLQAAQGNAALDAACVETAGTTVYVYGYSYSAPLREKSEARARQAAWARLVHHLGQAVTQRGWREAVGQQHTQRRSRILSGLRAAVAKADSLETRKWRALLWKHRAAVARSLHATARQLPKPREETFARKVQIADGTRWRVWVRLAVEVKAIQRLTRQYATPVTVVSQRVTAVDYFPALAWIYPEHKTGAVVLHKDKARGPWKDTPLKPGSLVLRCAQIPVESAARFRAVVVKRAKELQAQGGPLECFTKDRGAAVRVSFPVARVKTPPRVIYRNGSMGPDKLSTMGVDVWNDPTK